MKRVHQKPILLSTAGSQNSWIFFLLAAFCVLVLAPLLQKGCFIDGMLYKTVAYNYAEGLSTFWNMKFTDTSMSGFCEQPPLYFYLLGSAYRLSGEYHFTDRVFTWLLFAILCGLTYRILRFVLKMPAVYTLLALFFFLSIPVFCWSYVNQVIEPLLCVFTCLGILFFTKFVRSGRLLFIGLFVAAVYCLFLTKGFQSCFLMVLPFAYAVLSVPRARNYLFAFASALLFLGLLALTLRLYAPAITWMDCYYQARLVLTMNNVGNTTDNHLEIIGRFFSELIICLACIATLFLYFQTKQHYPLRYALKNFVANRLAVALLITAIAGSFPYALSLVQRGFYLLPAFVCFVLAIVIGFKRYWMFLFAAAARLTRFRLTRLLFLLLFLGGVVYSVFSVRLYKRNEALLKDVELILPYLKKGEQVAIEAERWNDFSLHAYLYMAKEISLSLDKNKAGFLIRSQTVETQDPVSESKVMISTRELNLFILKKQAEPWKRTSPYF